MEEGSVTVHAGKPVLCSLFTTDLIGWNFNAFLKKKTLKHQILFNSMAAYKYTQISDLAVSCFCETLTIISNSRS